MEDIVYANIAQCQFDWAELNLQSVPELNEIGIEITPLPETQEYWWSGLEYQNIPRKPGIYAIINTTNGHFYIGSAVSLYNRKSEHFSDLRKGKHHSQYLQRAYIKYNTNAFRFVIIEHIEASKTLLGREQHYIDTMNPEYNINPTAGSQLGVKHSEETKARMSAASKGKPKSEEHKANLSTARKGRKRGPMSEKQKAKLSKENTGRTHSEATRAKISTGKKGKKRGPFSEEHKANIGIANKGKHSHRKGKPSKPCSEATRAKQREAMKGNINAKGYKHSEATKDKISATMAGKKRGPYKKRNKEQAK